MNDTKERQAGRFEAAALRRTLCLFVLLWPAAVAGCVDDDATDDWRIDETHRRPLEMRQGIYEQEYEMLRDSCDQRLERAFGKVEDWPPPLNLVWLSEVPQGAVRFNAFTLRDGKSRVVSVIDNTSHTPADRITMEWPSVEGFHDPSGFLCDPYRDDVSRTRMHVRLLPPDRIEVRVDESWDNFTHCVDERHYEFYELLPQAPCETSYLIHLRLREPCAPPCNLARVNLAGGVDDGYGYTRFDGPLECVCE